jgi:predicted protein tyrosine phosphatase
VLPYRLSICGIQELPNFADQDVSHVVSILDPGHPDPIHFAMFPPHDRVIWRYHDIVNEQPEQVRPGDSDVRAILDFGRALAVQDVRHLLVHCHMGLSRSTACALILMVSHGAGEADAFEHLRAIRLFSWPNSRMLGLADEMLGRGGRLVAEMKDHHRRMAKLRPDLVAYLRTSERAAEVPPAE